MCWLTHVSDDERYRWLNDVVCVGTGEVRPDRLFIDVAELIWEPPPEDEAHTSQRSQRIARTLAGEADGAGRMCNDQQITVAAKWGCARGGDTGSVSRSLPTGTITFLFTDIEGSTRLLQRLGDDYGEVLGTHARLLREAAAGQGGCEVATQGDAFFIAFADARGAIGAAVDAQRSLLSHPWQHRSPVLVRMGLHTGTAAIVDGDYVGLDVHRASRIAGAAHGGQVVMSAETYHAVDGSVEGVAFEDLGEHVLKDIDEPEHIRQVIADGLPRVFPPLRSLQPPTNIPRRAGMLVGRRHEFAELRRLVCDPVKRIVTVVGPGGVGKTRLAGAVGLDVLAEFSGGALFVDLTPIRDPNQMVVEIATVVGVIGRVRSAAARRAR